ncbi:MAG TPA: YfiR family protein [Methylomirabilota bacterium]|nr:YfiR family protein [Methylomirabilota bacterium]
MSQVKAAYLYNFVKLVEWPSDAFQSTGDPAVICVIGDDRTGEVLQQAVVGRRANGRRVEARRPRSANEFRACQVLFIGFSDKDRIAGILRGLHNSNVLTVGQADQFLSLGGMINLVERNGTIELEIDPEATDAAGLKVSSRLMVVSRIVTHQHRGGGRP